MSAELDSTAFIGRVRRFLRVLWDVATMDGFHSGTESFLKRSHNSG